MCILGPNQDAIKPTPLMRMGPGPKPSQYIQDQNVSYKHEQTKESQSSLLKRFFFVYLIAVQFGIDSTLWLPTAFAYISTLVTPSDAHYYLSVTQLLPAAIQFLVSILVGPTVAYFGCSLKWPMVFFIMCSSIGNFIYSCAGTHAIGNVWAMIGGRMLSGLASGSSSLSMTYIVVSSSTEERLKALSNYRTFAGIALVVGPILSLALTTFTFMIGNFEVSGNNAPTFVSSGISLCIAIITAIAVQDKQANQLNFLKVLCSHQDAMFQGGRLVWLIPLLGLSLLFISSFLMADILYLMSDLMRSPDHWGLGLTLISGLQAAVFLAALIGSIFTETMRKAIGKYSKKWFPAQRLVQLKDTELQTKNKSYSLAQTLVPELLLSVLSFCATILGAILVIIGLAILDKEKSMRSGIAGSVACFLIGCAVTMIAYNIQAASLPSLYSKSLPVKLRAVLTPWYGATVALGKLAAPPIVERIGATRTDNKGWIGSQALCIAMAFLAALTLSCTVRKFVNSIIYQN